MGLTQYCISGCGYLVRLLFVVILLFCLGIDSFCFVSFVVVDCLDYFAVSLGCWLIGGCLVVAL